MEAGKRKSYVGTLAMAWFLGLLGVHRFYTGYILIGVVQLLTVGGLGIWTFVDVISLIMNKYKDVNGQELEGYNIGCATIIGFIIVITLVISIIRNLM